MYSSSYRLSGEALGLADIGRAGGDLLIALGVRNADSGLSFRILQVHPLGEHDPAIAANIDPLFVICCDPKPPTDTLLPTGFVASQICQFL